MNRLLLLLLLMPFTGSFRLLAQRPAHRQLPTEVLKNSVIIPGPAQPAVPRSGTLRQAPDATCDTILLTRQSQIDSFPILYPGCTTVEILEINGAGASPAITQLDSLQGITNISRKLKISHTSITSLAGLSSLVNPGDTLELAYNFSLTSIGLNNLGSLGHIYLLKLPALNSITGLATGISNIGSLLIDSTALTSLDGLEDVMYIAGNLEIWHTPLSDLGSMTSLVSIGGALKLDQMNSLTALGLTNLTQLGALLLSGLPNLTQLGPVSHSLSNRNLGTFWIIQTGLTSLSGMDSIQSLTNFYIWLNPDLTSLQGLEGVSGNVPAGISLWGNDALTDITALGQITSISNGELDLHGNNQLADLTGLGNILTIGKRFRIYENPVVTSLGFLNNALVIQDQDNQGIQIENNPLLAVCSFTPLCNYLSNGGFGTIQNNAAGCNSITEIQAGCGGGCVAGVLRTWNGTQGTDWNDPANWTPAGVPGYCDRVYIPSGVPDNPLVNGNISIGGLIIESGSSLDMNGYSLTVRDTLHIEDGDIYGAHTILFRNIHDPYIFDGSIQAGNGITLDKYYGSLDILYSAFDGNFLLTDSIGRSGIASLQGNSFNNDLTIIGTSQQPGAHTVLSGAADDFIFGSLTIAYTSVSDLYVGAGGGTLYIGGDLNLNTDVDPARIVLNSVGFNGGNNSHIRQFGSVPVSFNNLYTEKFSKQQLIIPEQPVYLRNSACLVGGLIKTSPSALLIAEDNASINCHSSESWVWGPLKKIGNDEFTFVVGDSLKKALLTMATAPAQVTDAFTARYFRVNPASAGFDTSLHASSLTTVSGKEYWQFTRDNGNSRVRINLQYDSTRSQQLSSIYSLRASQWNGSQWINNGALSVTGNLHEAYVTSQDSLQVFGPVTLGYVIPPRIPVITLTQMDTIACRGTNLKVRFTVDTLMFPTNTFSAQLSDSTGSFASPLLIGQVGSASTADSINAFIPFNIPLSASYRVRVTGTAPPDTSVNTRPLSVKTIPQVSFTITGPAVGCINSGVQKYYPSQPEAGVNYNWTVSGGTFTTNQDTAFVTWTTPGTRTISLITSTICGNGPSSSRNITVSFPAPTAAPVITSAGRWLFASAPDTAQRSLGYRWFRNDTLISGAVNASYYASLGGNYTVRYYNLCGNGPASNIITYAANSLPQTISFPAIPAKTYGDAPFPITATASSGFPVTLSLVSGPGSLSGNTYTITTTGTTTLRATQPGDDVYDTAAIVLQTVTIQKAAQNIIFAPIPDRDLSASPLTLTATASSGLPVIYSLQSGPASLSGNQLSLTGLGTVSVTAQQPGDTNYLAAAPVNRSFCVRVAELSSINGPQFVCPGQTATYRINKVTGLTYNWRLTDGTNFASTADTVTITWSGSGTKTLLVSATGPCGAPTANDTLVVNIISAVSPGAVSNMLPVNGATDQQLPLNLSWQPGINALTYDLYLWDSAATEPILPFAANLANNAFLLTPGTLIYNKAYKWKVVSKNACLETAGPIQYFRLKKLPDLVVSQVQAPAAAFSGQSISINWTVTNAGPGNTGTSQGWSDAVFLSFDTLPEFTNPQLRPESWNIFEFPVRPLLVGTRSNVSSLDSGQQYQNSINFTLPVSYSQPLYAYVITNYPAAPGLQQMQVINDTNRAAQPIAVTLSPTPDLRVDTVFTPGAVFSGSTINVTYKVRNYGVITPAGSTWTDKFYISQSPLFNSNTAIPLKAPRANGTYYPNPPDAVVPNSIQLAADSSYTRSADVVIPNFISGQWFVFVQTNATASVYEGPLANNNFNNRLLQVFLTPTPRLTVSNLLVPVTSASITQPLGINWTILNTGFSDNREKNKGHYYRPAGTCQPNVLRLTDSVGFGSSFWIDRVYLSTDSTGINSNALLVAEITQGVENSGIGADAAPFIKCVPPGTDPSTENINTFNVIRPGSSHPGQLNFVIPPTLQPGNYFIYVRANATQTVFEYPGTPQIRRSALPIAIQRPDITVSASVPASSTAGQPVTISYNLVNNGPGAVFNTLRRDWIYMSSSPVFNGSAQLIDSLSVTESIPVGSPVLRTRSYTLPGGVSGMRYFFVRTNADSSFRETDYSNNISPAAATMVVNPTPADLVVSAVPLADSLFTIFGSQMKYTVINNGPGSTYGSWTDSIFISCSPVFNPASSYFVARRTQNRILQAGASYSDSSTVNMNWSWLFNNCFPETETATAYFFVKTNASGDVFEGANNNNNVTGSGARVLVNPLVDHIITSATGPDTVTVARPFTASWTVKNRGYNPGGLNYNIWLDAVYFSPDSVENGNDVLGSSFVMSRALERNQSFTETKTAIPPNLPTGDYYVLVKSNANNNIVAEMVRSNNSNFLRNANGAAKKVHVIQPLLPDLTDTILVAPASIPAGQPVTVVHRITNTGAGPVYPNTWSTKLWLSQDFVPGNAGDRQIGGMNKNIALQPGQSVTDTMTITLDLNTHTGNYILIAQADAENNVFETSETNNLGFRNTTVFLSQPVDLVVENVSVPDTVLLGYSMDTVRWEVANLSPYTASGVSADGIYLSKNPVLDSTAVLVGIKNKTLNMSPLSRDTISARPLVTTLTEGAYRVIVRTDLLNNINESNKNNNNGMAAAAVYVKARELKLGQTETNTLHTVSRFYKLVVPDSLRGATILVSLRSNDSLTMRNELYIGLGYVPLPARFDYRFSTANYGNQQIVMSSVTDSVYYIMARCVSAQPVVQDITLQAVRLPFAILQVQSASGGNIGNVTVKLSGSLFTQGMMARLSKPGTTIPSSALYFVNSTTVFATFNLQGQPQGLYDVSLIKTDSSVATLAGSFTITSGNNGGMLTGGGNNTGQSGSGNAPGCDPGTPGGLNSLLITELVVPERVFADWPFVIQINYANPANFDIPVQSRTLYNDQQCKMAFTQAGLTTGTNTLYLELTEPGGPPGIIRAGGSGSVTIYVKAPANIVGHTMIKFTVQ